MHERRLCVDLSDDELADLTRRIREALEQASWK